MFSNITQLRKDLLYVQGASSIAIARQRMPLLNSIEMNIILSLMYRYKGITPPSPRRETTKTNTDSWDVIFGMLIHHCEDGTSKFKQYYLTLSYDWQVVLHAILSKRILRTVGDTTFLDSIETLHSKEALMGMITLPSVLPYSYETQFIRKGTNKVSFPISAYKVGKQVNISKLKFLVNYGTKTITNTRKTSSKKEILSNDGVGRVGVIFTEHRVKGYKHRTTVCPLLKGQIDSILSLYKGKYYDNKNITILPSMKYEGTFNSKEELGKFIKTNYKKNFLFLSKEGLCNITTTDTYVELPCIDYILDDEYNAIGVKVKYNDEVYDVYFNIVDSQLNEGILGRFIRCNVRAIEGVIVEVKFNSVVNKWHKLYDSCLCCGTINTKHAKNGICSRCIRKFIKDIQTGYISYRAVDTEDISLLLNVDGSNYQINVVDKCLEYKLIKGQGVLNLGG